MPSKKHILSGWLRILSGLAVYSFGVHLTIVANIGLAPWDCLGMGIAKRTPLDYGSAMVLIGVCAIVIQLILRERIGFATLFDAMITGRLTQFFIDISPYPENHSLWLGIVFMLFGFLFIALGMYVYMSAECGCGPKDGLLIAIGKRVPKIPIGIVEILRWSVVTLIGWMLGGTVGIGTVISTFGAGAVMHLFYTMIHFEPRKLRHRSIKDTFSILFDWG
ncbi:YitT family protein [Ruminococcus sp. XPD3002]|uniref:YczE/YyaS/YitT family protein n=1 Tax=Ruminococcus sp. XPD3002 TaxID=1452269 RepID=UPI0009241FA0|nr:Uncharacterized membrane protein YczE [Ruminococcus flavefaciens]